MGIFSAANVLIAALLLVPAVLSDQGTTFVARFLRNRIVAWIGLVSFGLYLWHVFVLKELASMFNGSLVPLGATIPLAVVAYGLTLGIAAVSWYLMERHVLAWAHRRSLLRADR